MVQFLNGQIRLDDISPSRTEFQHGATIISQCRYPLVNYLTTTATRTCHDGVWQGADPICGMLDG